MILVCTSIFMVLVVGVEIAVPSEDVLTVVGDQVLLSCGVVRDRDNQISNCSWVGPNREELWAGGSDEERSVFIERDQDFYYCVLEIARWVNRLFCFVTFISDWN